VVLDLEKANIHILECRESDDARVKASVHGQRVISLSTKHRIRAMVCPAFFGVGFLDPGTTCPLKEGIVGRRGYPAEFRRKVLDLVESGRSVADVARDLDISTETIYAWRRQDRIDRGLAPGLTSTEKTELAAANKRIAELEAELAVHRRASELLGKVVPPKDGSRRSR
jgi:transposase-like protein